MMVEILDFEAARARQRINRADRLLDRANELAADCGGVAINLAVCNRIRVEQQRVIDAQARLAKLNPTVRF
ncbi:hypothetical protein ACWGTI_29500 [Mesorhizobium sp. ArgA1]